MRSLTRLFQKPHFPVLFLVFLTIFLYYKLFFLGKIPFPGDLLIASYFPWLDYYKIPVQNPIISDVFSQLYLWKHLAAEMIKNHQWPLWNPYSFNGTPLLANYQSATLYPLNILIFLPKNFGWGLFIFSQTLIAIISMYVLLSKWLKSALAPILGAVIFALSSLMATWLQLGTVGHAMAWLPLSFWFIEKFLDQKKVRYLLFLSFSLSLTVLAGHLQVSIYTFVLTFSLVIFRVFSQKNNRIKTALMLFLPFILSLGLTSIQLLPSVELLQKSIRTTDSYIQSDNFGLLPAGDFIKFFAADFFGNPITGNYWGYLNYFETSAFLGSVSLVLVIFTLLYLKKSALVKFLLFFLVVSLILLFQNPLSESVYQANLPILTFSYAGRILFVTIFTVSILVAFSLDQILNLDNQFDKLLKCIRYSLAFFIGILLGVLVACQISKHPNNYVTLRNSLLPLFLVFLVFVSSLVLSKWGKVNKKYALVTVIVCLIILDLSKYFLKFNPFVDQKYIFPTTPAIEYLKTHQSYYRVGREHAEVFPPNTWMAYGISSLEGYDPLYFNEYGKFMHYLNGGNPKTGNSGRYAELSATYHDPFIDASAVKYFVVHLKFSQAGYQRVFSDKSTVILENPQVMDRAYFAPNIITASQEKVYELMAQHQLDPHQTVALTADLGISNVNGQGAVKILNFLPNQVILSTVSQQDQVLVLADQYDEGWHAQIDGKETKVVRANMIFRAIKVPFGLHRVVFSYFPASFELGLKIFTLTCLAIFFITLTAYFRKVI